MELDTETWTEALEASVEEFTESHQVELVSVSHRHGELPDLGGSMIALRDDECTHTLLCLADAEGQRRLARMVAQMEPEEHLDSDDIKDAMREFSNIFAGTLKAALMDAEGLLLSLPMSVEAVPARSHGSAMVAVDVRLRDVALTLVIAEGMESVAFCMPGQAQASDAG